MTNLPISDGEGDTFDKLDDIGETDNIPEYRMLEAGDKIYDMSDEAEARKAEDYLKQKREALNSKQLLQYEDKATQFGLGGRSELLYDQVRVRLAVRYHENKHDMTWEEQHEYAERVVRIRATQTRNKWSR